MPTAPVDNNGTVLFFEDTGPVAGSNDYTTLVIFNGTWFHGEVFKKILPFGSKSNVRIVRVNRKNYPGSSRYNEKDLSDMTEGNTAYLERLGKEVATFLTWFARTNDIPKISPDRTKGGYAVMGWSMGNATTLSLIAYPDKLGGETVDALEPYLRKLIFYDPPSLAFGYDNPPENGPPPPGKTDWAAHASSYHNHPDLSSRKSSGLNFTYDAVNPSTKDMTAEELAQLCDEQILAQGEGLMMLPPMWAKLRQQSDLAVFTPPKAFKDIELVYITCLRSIGVCVWSYFETARISKENPNGRRIRFIEVPKANHFLHWDEPVTFWDAAVDAISK